MTKQAKLGGTFTLPGTAASLYRMGYEAMQLAGPEVTGLHGTLTGRSASHRRSTAWRHP